MCVQSKKSVIPPRQDPVRQYRQAILSILSWLSLPPSRLQRSWQRATARSLSGQDAPSRMFHRQKRTKSRRHHRAYAPYLEIVVDVIRRVIPFSKRRERILERVIQIDLLIF